MLSWIIKVTDLHKESIIFDFLFWFCFVFDEVEPVDSGVDVGIFGEFVYFLLLVDLYLCDILLLEFELGTINCI